jgi:DNA-binding transcriptional regulator YhcF (GntR family)
MFPNGRRLVLVHLQVDTSSPVPPYEQIRAQLGVMVTSGVLPEGTRLPPIRQLAGDLGLATNTVGRAYHELELEGLVETRGRHGTVVRPQVTLDAPERQVVVEQAADAFALEVQHHGAGLDDALAAVRHAFQRLRDAGAPIPSTFPSNEAAT